MLNLINKFLRYCAANGYLEVVNILKGYALIDNTSQYGDITLMLATRNGHLDVVELLIENGADVNQTNQHGASPLMWAAWNNHLEVVRCLVENGADVNHINGFGTTALILAIKSKHLEIVKLIKEINELKIKKLLNTEKTIFEVTSILIDQKKWNNSKKMEEEICKIVQYYEYYINLKFKVISLKIHQLLKKEFINNLKFGEENYSLLHIAVLNNWQKLVTYLVNKWPIDIDYKDSSGNSAWNYSCLLLQQKNAVTIKNYEQLIAENKNFIKELIPLSPNWHIIKEKNNDKVSSKVRKEIFKYYLPEIKNSVDTWEYVNSGWVTTNWSAS